MLTIPENVKSLFWVPVHPAEREQKYLPHLFLEAKIDFSDVRTGFNESYTVIRAVDIPSDTTKPFWDDDAVREIKPASFGPAVPKEVFLIDLPGCVLTDN